MAFWTAKNAAPVQSHKFMVSMTNMKSFTVKSVTKPTLEYNEGVYQVGNHKFKYPGVHTWGDVTITLVDDKETTRRLISQLLAQGLANPTGIPDIGKKFTDIGGSSLYEPTQFSSNAQAIKGNIGTINIEQHGNFDFSDNRTGSEPESGASILETWTLHDAFIKSVNFGQLDYSSDELISLEIVVAYDYCTVTYGSSGNPEKS